MTVNVFKTKYLKRSAVFVSPRRFVNEEIVELTHKRNTFSEIPIDGCSFIILFSFILATGSWDSFLKIWN